MVNNLILKKTIHFIFLISYFFKAIKLLYKATAQTIELAKVLLENFSDGYVRLYSDFNCTFNFHIITKHLVEDVQLHGSIIGHTMFSFESLFGYLLPSIHGTTGIGKQYLRSKLLFNTKILLLFKIKLFYKIKQ